MAHGYVWFWVIATTALPVRAEVDEPRVDELEQRTQNLSQAIGDTAVGHCASLVRKARLALGKDAHVAASLLGLVMRQCPEAAENASVVLDAARIEAVIGTSGRALEHFAAASRIAQAAHEVAPAVEGYVALADRVGHVQALPPVDRYIAIVGRRARLDRVGYETLYRLGRTLARRDDARALDVLREIPNDDPAARRALYVRGAFQLKRGDVGPARALLLQAAELPVPSGVSAEELARDAQVSELAWLAVGRLAFEGGDTETGFFAYQQVLVQSPGFSTAFLELGWLAMETGNEEVALLAFEPLMSLDPGGEVGRRAGLLKGYVLLHQREYDLARQYYQAVANRYTHALADFEREVAGIEDLANLSHDCDVRQRALTSSVLAPMMDRLEIEKARRLDQRLAILGAQVEAGALQLRTVEDLLAGRRHPNPLRAIARARETAVEILQDVNALSLELGRTAARHVWRAETEPGREPGCCEEPNARLRTLRATLESLVMGLDEREQRTRANLESLHRELNERHARDRQRYDRLVPEVHSRQRELASAAVAATREQLRTTAIEGDAGVLEAIWRFKEDHRDLIESLEIERKARIGRLEQRFEDAILELYSVESR